MRQNLCLSEAGSITPPDGPPLRILVYFNHLELGGSQLNGLDLAAAMVERGHHVVGYAIYDGEPGPLADLAVARGVPLILDDRPGLVSTAAKSRRLVRLARQHRIDLIHALEPSAGLECFYGPHVVAGVPLVITVYTMEVPVWMPRIVPLILGTADMVQGVAPYRTSSTVLVEPPVDTDADCFGPLASAAAEWRTSQDIKPADIAVIIVSRLASYMKAEGIERAIRAIGLLDDDRLRLVVIGTGEASEHLGRVARAVNSELGYEAVRLSGPLLDPRPAYAGADIVLGMGGSALRAMSFEKPLVVLGVNGFSRSFTPETMDYFLAAGFFGHGEGDLDPGPLAAQISPLASDPELRGSLGTFGRQLVVDRFSLRAATDRVEGIYRLAVAESSPMPRRVFEAAWIKAYQGAAKVLPRGLKRRLRAPALRLGAS
jgi:glycosyltransferase involved in cell wall biosynthesis